MEYTKKKASQISFPLGGIGTGCIGLAGNGSLVDVEIKNRPNKNSTAEFTHFAIKAENEHEVLDARILQGRLSQGLYWLHGTAFIYRLWVWSGQRYYGWFSSL